jgi:hypothetical protein
MKNCQLEIVGDSKSVMCASRKCIVALAECDACLIEWRGQDPISTPSTTDELNTATPAPSIVDMAWSVSAAMFDFAASGFEVVSKQERVTRLKLCDSCKTHRNGWKCSACGCIIPFKVIAKAWRCPIGNW